MNVYYNEFDPHAAQWLRNLIAAGLIPHGDVDERSIVDVHPEDVRGYDQCHWFAGIAGWPRALQLAGWGDRPVWTGSCPCQPISSAGQHGGHADERHLWPAFYRLIAECRPATVFGEQVSGALGLEWLSGVRADLEHADYACGCADLSAAGVGSPQNRRRLYWVADAQGGGKRQNGHEIQGAPGGCSSAGAWDSYQLLPGIGTRRIESGTLPLVDGIPGYVDRLRAYGNAIVPPLAAEFVAAFMECQ